MANEKNELKVKRNELPSERINQLVEIKRKITKELYKDPEIGYDFFLEEWDKLSLKEKNLIGFLINDYCNILMDDPGTIDQKREIFFHAIINLIEDELNANVPITKLKIGKEYNLKEIVKVFVRLLDRGAIISTKENLANVLAEIFSQKKDTILQYIKKPDNLEKTEDIIEDK